MCKECAFKMLPGGIFYFRLLFFPSHLKALLFENLAAHLSMLFIGRITHLSPELDIL